MNLHSFGANFIATMLLTTDFQRKVVNGNNLFEFILGGGRAV